MEVTAWMAVKSDGSRQPAIVWCGLTPNHRQTFSVGGTEALQKTLSANMKCVSMGSGDPWKKQKTIEKHLPLAAKC